MRAAVVAGAAVFGMIAANGTASAAIDDSNFIIDGTGTKITVSQADTFINSVAPLDGNPLTREWFHNGRAIVDAEGPGAEDFSGTATIGYQFGYPGSLNGTLSFGYSTPNVSAEFAFPIGSNGSGVTLSTNDLLPSASIGVDLTPGPGLVEVDVAEGDVSGPHSEIQASNVWGTATNILGNVSVRPYVKVTSDLGDVVVTYGTPWRFA